MLIYVFCIPPLGRCLQVERDKRSCRGKIPLKISHLRRAVEVDVVISRNKKIYVGALSCWFKKVIAIRTLRKADNETIALEKVDRTRN